MLGNNDKLQPSLAGSEIWAALNHTIPHVAAFVANKHGDMVNLKVSFRGEHDFLAIAKKYDDTGVLVVCFGSGPDFVSSLLGLAVAMEHNKWRPDRYGNQ